MRTHSSLELLEARIAPAGVVKVAIAGGTITLTGDDAPNVITITPTAPGMLRIDTDATTLSVGGAAGVAGPLEFSYTKDLKVALKGGNDQITLGTGNFLKNITLDGGDGNNTFKYNGLSLAGTLSILATTGSDTINAAGSLSVGRDYLVKLGDGSNVISGTATSFSVLGKLNVLSGKGSDNLAINAADITVGSDATFNTGSSPDVLTFRATNTNRIFGKLSITTAQKGPPPPQMSAPSSDVNAGAGVLFSVRGDTTITTKDGMGGMTLGGATNTSFGGKLSVKAGSSTIFQIIGDTQLYLGDVSFSMKDFTSLTIKPAKSYFMAGKFTYTGGAGLDSIDMMADGIIAGNATFSLGDGFGQTLNFGGKTASGVAVLGNLTISSAAKNEMATSATSLAQILVNGKFALTTGNSIDTINMDDFTIRGTSAVKTGKGNDKFLVETRGTGTAYTGSSVFVGAFTGSLGDGDDTGTFGQSGANLVTFTAVSNLDAGTGTDTITPNVPKLTVKNGE